MQPQWATLIDVTQLHMARVVRQLSTNKVDNQSRLKFHQEMSTNLVITNLQQFKHEALVKNMSMELTHDRSTIIKVSFYYWTVLDKRKFLHYNNVQLRNVYYVPWCTSSRGWLPEDTAGSHTPSRPPCSGPRTSL